MRKDLLTQTRRAVSSPVRLLFCHLLLLLFFYAASGQDKKSANPLIHLTLANKPVSEALQSIEKQAGITFHFDKTGIDLSRIISLHLDNVTLNQALDALTRQTGYQFRQKGDKVLIVGVSGISPASAGETGENAVTGTVLDNGGLPIQGVSVIVQGTTTGTQTDANGLFSINAVRGNLLVFSFIGFETKTVRVSQTALGTISLEENKKELGEVIVTALGIQRQ